jgi:predicted phage terminase large subunit-like protein
VIQVVDSAFSADVAADWSVIATWGATANQIYLLDVWRKRVEYPQLIRALKDQYAKWEHASPWLYIENKASGQSAIQTIRQETAIPVRKFEPGTASKMARAQSGTLLFEAGRVVLPDAAPWLAAWIDEHLDYGAETAKSDAHDDQVDTSSMATKILGRMLSGIPATPEESPDA